MALEDLLAGSLLGAGLMAYMGAILVGVLIIYIYTSYTLMKVAQKLKSDIAWMAWIPILNFYLIITLAKAPSWTLLALLLPLIPFLGGLALLAFIVWLFWKICERLGFPAWLSLLMIIPIGNLVLLGILAWAKPRSFK